MITLRAATGLTALTAILLGYTAGAAQVFEPAKQEAPSRKKSGGNPPPRLAGSAQPARVLTETDLEAIWKDLGRDDDAGVGLAYQHINAMIQSPASSMAFLKPRVKVVATPDSGSIGRWIEDLDSNDFDAREKAMSALERIGPLAAAPLRKKLADGPPLEAKRRIQQLLDKIAARGSSTDELRMVRAVEVLFGIATPDARGILEELARGAPGARVTDEARRSLAALSPR
jgi:hypothetical protein